MDSKIVFSDTMQQQELLENLLIEFNKFSNIDTNFWAWCNANEGVIAFWSVIASFLVSIVAVGLSVYTFRSQKILQTKSIQENAKLQRELTEQNNKFQADLQLRQIKLNMFKEKFDCYYSLSTLMILRFRVLIAIDDYKNKKMSKTSIIAVLENAYKDLVSSEKILKSLRKVKLFFDKEEHEQLDELFFTFYNISVRYIELGQLNYNEKLYNFNGELEQIYQNFIMLEPVYNYLKKIESDINLYLIDKIELDGSENMPKNKYKLKIK